MRNVTDARQPGEPKDAEGSHLYTLYRAFATPAEYAVFRRELEDGLGWGDAKQRLCERIEQELGSMRERYAQLMARPDRIDDRSEEHTSELQSLMRISYAVFCLKKKTLRNQVR